MWLLPSWASADWVLGERGGVGENLSPRGSGVPSVAYPFSEKRSRFLSWLCTIMRTPHCESHMPEAQADFSPWCSDDKLTLCPGLPFLSFSLVLLS